MKLVHNNSFSMEGLEVFSFLGGAATSNMTFSICSFVSVLPSFCLVFVRPYFFGCDSSSISHNVGMSVCCYVPKEFYGSVMMLLVYKCCYYCCSLYYQSILMSHFAFLAAIAALQVTMLLHKKFFYKL